MNCGRMIELEEGIFQDSKSGNKYIEITKEMIVERIDNDIDNFYAPWTPAGPKATIQEKASTCFKMLRPELYDEWFLDYLSDNNIEAVNEGGKTRYFEYNEDAHQERN